MIADWNLLLAAKMHMIITGGAGYIGTLLTGVLLSRGHQVTVLDDLLFGGEALLGYWHHPHFRFVRGDVCEPAVVERAMGQSGHEAAAPRDHTWGEEDEPGAVIHLAAIVGFPACQQVGRAVAWRYNVEATKCVFEASEAAGVERFIFASTYSNYGMAGDGKAVTEESPLNPQSVYAETKIAAEEYLLERARTTKCAPMIFRFATLFGISPRTRFDLIVNQFVLEALTKRELVIYQRGYSRSFVHVRDVVEGIYLGLQAPAEHVRGQVYNLGSDALNYTKDEIVTLVQQYVPGTKVTYKDLSFGGDMRDIRVSFEKISKVLGFSAKRTVEEGICEVRNALEDGLIKQPMDGRYRNAQFIVQ